MRKRNVVYQIAEDREKRTADVRIYGNISSRAEIMKAWYGEDKVSEVSAFGFTKELEALDVDVINVCINSYGGEVAEALAIYSALTRHKAEVHTYNDGFCCSAATIIFCAGAKRTAGKLSLMMIHNCSSYVGYADSDALRKAAEDNDKINGASIQAYKRVSNLPEEKIRQMMDKETWLDADECVKCGFATDIADDDDDDDDDEGTVQSAFGLIRAALVAPTGEVLVAEESEQAGRVIELLEEIRGYVRPAAPAPIEETGNTMSGRAAEFFKHMV